MTFFIKNKNIESRIEFLDTTDQTSVAASNAAIARISSFSTFLYSTDEIELFIESETALDNSNFQTGEPIVASLFYKRTDESQPSGYEIDKYVSRDVYLIPTLVSSRKITFNFTPESIQAVAEMLTPYGLTAPDIGILKMRVSFRSPFFVGTYMMKISTRPLFSSAGVDSGFIDLSPMFSTQNTYRTAPYSFENLFIPEITGTFVYNFYETTEENFEVYQSRNYEGDILSNVPKYISLSWRRAPEMFIPVLIPLIPGTPTLPQNPTAPGVTRIGGTIVSASEMEESEIAGMISDGTSRSSGPYIQIYDIGGASGGAEGVGFGRGIGGAPGVVPSDVVASPVDDDAEVSAPPNIDFSRDQEGGTFSPQTPIEDGMVSAAANSDYIGYIIEKTRITLDGEEILNDIIAVSKKNTVTLIDYKIAYGESYKYRIRSVFRLVASTETSIYQDSDLALTPEQAGALVDETATEFIGRRSYYFDSEYSVPVVVECVDEIRPEAPTNVKCFPNSSKKYMFITWRQKDPFRDVVGFNVYRKPLGGKFTKLNREIISTRKNFYLDENLPAGMKYVYAIEAVDFHSLFSPLSEYVQAQLVEYDTFSNTYCEVKSKIIADAGNELNEKEKVMTEVNPAIICKSRFDVNINPIFVNVDESDSFVLRILSLDTGIKNDVKLQLKTFTIYHPPPYRPAPTFIFYPIDSEDLLAYYRDGR